MGRIIEGSWNCNYCGKKDIKARYKECPQCGHPQDKNTNFKMKDSHNYVSEDMAITISRKPKWECSFCGRLNFDESSECDSCGATKADSERNYFKIKEERRKAASVSESELEEYKSDNIMYPVNENNAEYINPNEEPEYNHPDKDTPHPNR